MVRHDDLNSVRHHKLRGKTLRADVVIFFDELSDIKSDTVADDVNDVLVADA